METLHGILIFIFSLSMGHCQECFVPGQCIDSDLVKHTITETGLACRNACHDVDECTWFTFKPQFNLCELFGNCRKRATTDCTDCTSGETDCKLYQCAITGSCNGHLIGRTETSSYNQCLMECSKTDACNWFTFEQPINMCYLFTDCVNLDETCTQCMSGEAGCPLLNEGYTKIMIAVGWNGIDDFATVEVVDTSDRNLVCNDLPPYPMAVRASTGGLLGNTPVICGGYYESTCYALVQNKWQLVATMSSNRHYYTASAVVGADMFVMGGFQYLDTSDLIGVDTIKPGPKLPNGVHDHCAVALNESTIMIIGGKYPDLPMTTTYYYHLDIDHWIEGPDLNTGRIWLSCATIKSNDQVVVVVAGGALSVEVLPTGGASEWSLGKPLPVKIHGGQLVPDPTGNGVFMVGGWDYTYHNPLDTIFHMACVECEWVEMTQTLKTARFWHVAIPVPDGLVTCQ